MRCSLSLPIRVHINLLLEIGQGAGLAGASGVRPFLPPLLAGALARRDIGIDFDDSAFAFLESTAFLVAMLALALLSYLLGRRAQGTRERAATAARAAGRSHEEVGSEHTRAAARDLSGEAPRPERDPVEAAFGVVAVVLGALMFGASLDEAGFQSWPGIVAGAICAGVAYTAVATLIARVRRRLDPDAAAFLPAYADGLALALAAIAIFLPLASFLVLVLLAVLLVRVRRSGTQKYGGLRILR